MELLRRLALRVLGNSCAVHSNFYSIWYNFVPLFWTDGLKKVFTAGLAADLNYLTNKGTDTLQIGARSKSLVWL